MDENGIPFEQFIEQLKELPPEPQQAICLLLKHIDVITQLQWEPMTLEEKNRRFAEAIQRKDYLSAVILTYKWLEQERGDEKWKPKG